MKKVRNIRNMSVVLLMVLLISHTIYAETYEYDALDRVTKVMYEDGSSVTYEYDAAGNMTVTQVTEPEQTLEEPEESGGLAEIVEDILEAVQTQVTENAEQMIQEMQTFISNLFGWIFGI